MSFVDNVIIIDDDSDDSDIEELRELAIKSMIKQEKEKPCISIEPIKYQINSSSSFLSFRKRSSSDITNEDSKRPKISDSKNDSVENIVKDSMLEIFDIDNILNSNKTDNASNLLKEEELKNKLIKALKNKKDNEIVPVNNNTLNNDISLYESDDDFDIFTNVLPPEEITDPNVLKYHNLITEVKPAIEELIKSINTMSASIQEKLIKSKKITTQIENLKNQKIQLHKEISINRSRILDFQKIKKQKSLELISYEHLKRKYEENQRRNAEFLDSLSTVSCETSDSKTSCGYDIDCNQLICPVWLNNICTNDNCIYQHPKFSSKPVKNQFVKVKENDKVFLKEMNSIGFVCKLKCDACSENILISTLHVTEDWYCKSCCQKLVNLKTPTDIFNQLIVIWHHIYKRYTMSRNLSTENRDPSLLQNLYKCAEAMRAKITTVVNLPPSVFISAGCHIIVTLDEESKIDELLTFIKIVKYNSKLVLFACSGLSFPIPKLYQLLIDTVIYLIKNSIFDAVHLILKEFCVCGRNLGLVITNQLFQWLELSIQLNTGNTHESVIDCLVEMILGEVIGTEFVPQITLSTHELVLGDKYWFDRKESIIRIANLFPSNNYRNLRCSNSSLLIKYLIFTNFYTGNEEAALELCEKYVTKGYFFLILRSKLSLNYNNPLVVNENDKVTLIEHTFNKAEWLLANRSIKSSVKLLESVPHILYKISKPIENSKQALSFYEAFLDIRSIIGDQTDSLDSNLTETEIKSILDRSAIWMCYISLVVLINTDSVLIDQIFTSDRLLDMTPEHLNRVAQFIIVQLNKLCIGAHYYTLLRRVFLSIDRSLEFIHFLDSFHVIDFDKLNDYQLQTWLFLIDFCIERFSRDHIDQFLVIISQRLLHACQNDFSANAVVANSCRRQVLHHIIMCYPIRCVEVWLNYVRLLLELVDSVPMYELIDACNMGITRFIGSQLLWQYYYECALKTGDVELPKKIKESAVKLGFDLSQS